ncbi:MAG TPA: hypothetical protein VGZ25_09405 [Gemmataceae bacterium]|nr:hypothetical protein [Gemmataceae bacterium]
MARKKDDPQPVIRIAPLGELNAYTIYEHELETLGHGSAGSVYFAFALALLPLSISFLITLLTTTVSSTAGLTFFICAGLVSFLFGLLCLVLWSKTHVSTRRLIDQIRNRMPPAPPLPQEGADPGKGTEA